MTNKGRPPTISQVAAAAGVDRSSVSRAFTRPELLSAQTVAAIRAAAEAIGYVPNRSARALSTGRTGNIALIVSDIANPIFPPLIRAGQLVAEKADICVFLGNTDEDIRQEEILLNRFAGQVDGIVLVSPQLTDEELRTHAKAKSLVVVNRDVEGVPRVLIDYRKGVFEAVEHLAELGHRRIAYIANSHLNWAARPRRNAVRKAAEEHGLTLVTPGSGGTGYEAGRQSLDEILAAGCSAVLASDDLTAQGILGGLAERGLRVPDRISVLSCDDLYGMVGPAGLTTISNRSAEAGRLAVNLLLETFDTRGMRDVRYVLETALVIGATTGPATKVMPDGKRG